VTLQRFSTSLLIVGNRGGSNVAESLCRAARRLGFSVELYGVETAVSSIRFLNALSWRLRDKRPPFSHRISRDLARILDEEAPRVLITTGLSPVEAATVSAFREKGSYCIHFSSDDPWNPGQRAAWHHRALANYDVVFTPRRSAVRDLERLPCRQVRYLPFAYDQDLVEVSISGAQMEAPPEVLFVGGADADRSAFFKRYLAAGAPITLVGGYWERFGDLRTHALGHKSPQDVGGLTCSAAINLCLVRRSNRDGHVMRSFEIGALGGCMVVEDTDEHREIFGADGECVVYFDSPERAAVIAKALLADEPKRRRLAKAVQQRIIGGANSYTDRLTTMLEGVESLAPSAERKTT